VREVLDRLREAVTALDRQLSELYFIKRSGDRTQAMRLLWKAKQDLWYAQMHILNAAAGSEGPGPP